jgi:CRISPR-associated endonuclease/helicase Cas3
MLMNFRRAFEILTANPRGPFPWQESLFLNWLSQGRIPTSCCLPTGMGKTNIVAVWLIALGYGAEVPRRLVYVVNRRTVVDQTTNEVERLRDNLSKLKLPGLDVLAISTLRGQFADNREWSADPSRPAVIVGTVDMIGSRLLFSGYGVGFKARPLHAGFLGQNALIVHDEAHLEPAFQKLLEKIADEQTQCKDFAKLRVMELTATTRTTNGSSAFELTAEEKKPPEVIPESTENEPSIHTVWRRLKARKKLVLTAAEDEKTVPGKIARIAEGYKDQQAAVLVFLRSVEAAKAVREELRKTGRPARLLTGTIRGKERDELVETDEFKRFLKDAVQGETVYLVCTSAGEVGIDISADYMVCDLSTFDSMAQRFGRVNRYGLRADTRIDVVCPSKFDDKDKLNLNPAREATLEILGRLNGDASPKALGDLRDLVELRQKVEEAFTPEPVIPPVTDILFDAWALTSIRQPMPGRPPVEPYLHGIAEWEPPETYVAWREEVGIITEDLLELNHPEDLLDDYPLLPRELLRDRSDRVFTQLETLAERHPESPAWILDERGGVEPTTMRRLADKERKSAIENKTVLLPPGVGGLREGMLDGESREADDVADSAADERGRPRRQRVWDDAAIPDGLRCFLEIRFDVDDADSPSGEGEPRRFWRWCDRPREGGRAANRPILWDEHVGHVVDRAKQIVSGLALPEELANAVIVAARLHDHGKRREKFQRMLGNRSYPDVVLAKSNGRAAAQFAEPFRHEFASVLDAENDPEFAKLDAEMRDLVLHLIAAHHGRARPHFNPEEGFDPDRPSGDAEKLCLETPRRFARLQQKYGRWGLAYLESLLRAADWAASAAESEGGA